MFGILPPTAAQAPSDDLHRRARGAYLGFAVGDALGAAVEFLTASEIKAKYGELREIVGGGWLRLKPGQITDDTQMSLALGAALLESGGFDLRNIAEHYLAWLKTKPVDVGNTCRRGIVRYMQHGSLATPPHDGDAGNGAAMRNLPLVLATLPLQPTTDHADNAGHADLHRYSLAQCHVTHNHPLSDAATLALAEMAQALLHGAGLDAARRIADKLVATHRNFRFEPYPKRATGYVVDTLQTVCHCLFTTEDFESCLVKTVNYGGDADTNAALVGMLAGAHYGVDAIPPRWLKKLDRNAKEQIERQVDGLLALRPLRDKETAAK